MCIRDSYYPIGDEKAEEGTVSLALGLGKYIVDGGLTLRVCPYHPNHCLLYTSWTYLSREVHLLFCVSEMKTAGRFSPPSVHRVKR